MLVAKSFKRKSTILTRFFISRITDPDLLEGDIIVTKSLERQIENMEFAVKNGITGSQFDAIANRAWVNGIIPYVFDGGFSKFPSCSIF